MQFQSIIAALSLALVATAVPTGTSNSGNTVCKGNNTASYCKTKNTGLLGAVTGILNIVVPVTVTDTLTCTTVLPILSGNQQIANACCDTSGSQTGLVNVGTICVPVNA